MVKVQSEKSCIPGLHLLRVFRSTRKIATMLKVSAIHSGVSMSVTGFWDERGEVVNTRVHGCVFIHVRVEHLLPARTLVYTIHV